MDKELFVRNIKERCRAKGVKPTVACRESGVGTSFITDINKGTTPSVSKVQMLAQYLGCTVSDLLGEKETPPDPVRQEFMRLLDSMTAEQRNELFAFMLRLRREREKKNGARIGHRLSEDLAANDFQRGRQGLGLRRFVQTVEQRQQVLLPLAHVAPSSK